MTRTSFQRGWVEERKQNGRAVWFVRYRVRDPESNGGWKIESQRLDWCQTKKQALAELSKTMAEINKRNNGPGRPAPVVFRDFTRGLWTQYLENKGIKPSTQYSYDSMLRKHVEPALGDLTLDQIRPIHLTSFFQKHRENGMATHYQLNLYSMLRTMFDVAVEYDLIESSPIRRKIHRPKSEPAEKAVLTAEEIQATLDQIPAPWRTLFACVAVTGLRSGEALGLRWKNIDWHAETLSVTHSLWRSQLVTPKTKKSIRTLHMPDALRRLLEAHYASSGFTDLDDYVFCKADGSPCDPNYLRKEVLYPAMDTAGIKRSSRAYGFHLFRHSAATIAHAETQNLKGTQDLLGHSRMSTTSDIYLHSDGKGTKEATEAIAKKVFETCSPVAPNLRPGSNRIQ